MSSPLSMPARHGAVVRMPPHVTAALGLPRRRGAALVQFIAGAATPSFDLITEAGDTRITEAGDTRVTE